MKIDKAFCEEGKDQVRELINKFCENNEVKFSGDAKSVLTQEEVKILKQQNNDWKDKVILDLIQPGDSVLDLGCGQGNLLLKLMNKGADVQGVEIDFESVMQSVEKGITVFQANLDQGLSFFKDNSFDYVVLEETAQTLHNPKKVFEEMLRIAKYSIVTFPNFGYWKVRFELLANGKMPVTEWLPYSWSDTPNIHLFTLLDFIEWTKASNTEIVKGYSWKKGKVWELGERDNLEAEEVLLILKKKD